LRYRNRKLLRSKASLVVTCNHSNKLDSLGYQHKNEWRQDVQPLDNRLAWREQQQERS
jgi:hypothetical protein